MRRQSILVLAIGVLYSALSGNVEAVVVFDDGNIHKIDYVIRGEAGCVEVANSPLGEVTKVNVVADSLISVPFITLDDSEVTIYGSSTKMAAFALCQDGQYGFGLQK